MSATIDTTGRLVIPKAVREAAGLKAGMRLTIRFKEGKVEIEPLCEPVQLVRKGSLMVAVAPAGAPKLTAKDVERTIRETREERGRHAVGHN